MRAYIISTLLFLGIVLLAVLYLGQKWGKWLFYIVYHFKKGKVRGQEKGFINDRSINKIKVLIGNI